jgi:hypothetical protein
MIETQDCDRCGVALAPENCGQLACAAAYRSNEINS